MELESVAVLLCSAAVAAALIYVFWTRTASSGWANAQLKSGDLYSLTEVASGIRPNGLTEEQGDRLRRRGFVSYLGRGRYRATLKGRLALRLRRTSRKRVAQADVGPQRSPSRSNG
jgi:hypothetical protein